MPLVPISTGVFAIIFSSEVLVLDLLCIIGDLREVFFGSGLVGGNWFMYEAFSGWVST